MTRHSAVQVRIEQSVLWIASEAYPLRNISHVGQRTLELDKSAAWKKFIIRTLITLAVGGILAIFVGTPVVIIMIAVLALLIWRLVSIISKPAVHGLVLNTAGIQHDAVWTTDVREIQYLVSEITKAIGKPDIAHMTRVIQNAVFGDSIQQYGAGSIGKAQTSSGDIRAGR